MVVDEARPTGAAAADAPAFIGAVQSANDWTANWTYGIHDGSRGAQLWFE